MSDADVAAMNDREALREAVVQILEIELKTSMMLDVPLSTCPPANNAKVFIDTADRQQRGVLSAATSHNPELELKMSTIWEGDPPPANIASAETEVAAMPN
jgi:hypothetical protein